MTEPGCGCGDGERALEQGTLVIIPPGAEGAPLSSSPDQVRLEGDRCLGSDPGCMTGQVSSFL